MDDRCGLSALFTELNETVEKIDATLNGQSRAWVNVQPCVMYSTMALCQAVVIQQTHIAALEEKVTALSTGMETLIQDAKLKEKRYKRDQIVGERQWDSMKSYIERLCPDQSKKSLCQDELLCSLSPHSPDRYLEPKNLSISTIELGFCGEHQKDHFIGTQNGNTAKAEEGAKENICGRTVAIEPVVQNHMCFVPEHSKWVYCGLTNNSSLGSLILSWDFQTLTINNETSVCTSPGKCLRSKCFWWHSKSRVIVLKDGLYRVTAGICNQNSMGLVSLLENSGNSSLIAVYVNGKRTTRSSSFQNSSNAKKTILSDKKKNSCSLVVSSSIIFVAQNSLVEFRLDRRNDIVEISRCFLEMEFIV